MQSELTRRRDKLFAFGLRMQPVVVVVGDIAAPSASYVVVDETVWKLSSPLKAVDICFKTFHVLHASYPAETLSWFLLQRLVYDVTTIWDVKSAAVSALLSDLQ